MSTTSIAFSVVLLASSSAVAQDNFAAGLFTDASHLPRVSQAMHVDVRDDGATLVVDQVFVNDGAAKKQADYRLHLPRGAWVKGFRFRSGHQAWVHATLKDERDARRDHRRAAARGDKTGLLRNEGAVQHFSVFPLPAKSRMQVQLTLALPVGGGALSVVRVPVARMLGEDASAAPSSVTTPVVIDVRHGSPLQDVVVDADVKAVSVDPRRQRWVGSTAHSFEVTVVAEQPAVVARRVALPDQRQAVEVRLVNDRARRGALRKVLLVDGSRSMRSQLPALRLLFAKLPDDVLVDVVGERRQLPLTDGIDAVERAIRDAAAGHHLDDKHLKRAVRRRGCQRANTRCVVVTDGALRDLPGWMKGETRTVVLTSSEALRAHPQNVQEHPFVVRTDVAPRQALQQLGLALFEAPLHLTTVEAHGRTLKPLLKATPLLYAHRALLHFDVGRKVRKLRLHGRQAGKDVVHVVDIHDVQGDDETQVRQRFYRAKLQQMVQRFERAPSEAQRKAIVALSVREGVPTKLTALHASAPSDRRGETVTYKKKTLLDFSEVSVAGALTKPDGAYLKSTTSKIAPAFGSAGVGSGSGGLSGRLGGRAKRGVRPKVKVSAARILGSVSKDEIKRVFRRHQRQIRATYERSLRRNPKLSGRIVLKLVIDKEGRVASVDVTRDTVGDKELAQALRKVIRRMRFPRPAGGGSVVVTYPFVFSTGE